MRIDRSPGGWAWAVFYTPEFPSISEHTAEGASGGLRIDRSMPGVATERANPLHVELVNHRDGDSWTLLVPNILQTKLAWHPERPVVAGAARWGNGIRLWVADYCARTVEVHETVHLATSLTMVRNPVRGPLVWLGQNTIAALTMAEQLPQPEKGTCSPRSAAGQVADPRLTAFAQELSKLAETASAVVSVVDLDKGSIEPLTKRLLVGGIDTCGGKVVVECLDETATRILSPPKFRWSPEAVNLPENARRIWASPSSHRRPSLRRGRAEHVYQGDAGSEPKAGNPDN